MVEKTGGGGVQGKQWCRPSNAHGETWSQPQATSGPLIELPDKKQNRCKQAAAAHPLLTESHRKAAMSQDSRQDPVERRIQQDLGFPMEDYDF